MPLGTEVGLGPGDIVRWGSSSPPKKGDSSPTFRPFLLWPTAGCIRIPLGTEVGLRPGDIVLDGEPAPLP